MNSSDRPLLPRRAARSGPGERGAVVVEAAILLPIIALLLFGLIEFGLIFKSELTVSSASGAAAREGAALPKDPMYRETMLDELESRMGGTGLRAEDWVAIYKANADGLPGTATSESEIETECEVSGADCTIYTYNGSTWDRGTQEWTAAEQSACRDDVLDRIGIYLSVKHDYITGFVGIGSRQVTNRAVYALEPRLPGECEPTP